MDEFIKEEARRKREKEEANPEEGKEGNQTEGAADNDLNAGSEAHDGSLRCSAVSMQVRLDAAPLGSPHGDTHRARARVPAPSWSSTVATAVASAYDACVCCTTVDR